jgi:lipoyl-dependent peroxiredoxin
MTTPADHIVRRADIHWEGDIARGHGTITTESGKINAGYSFGTRFSNDPGTNPEELLGAAHAACFTMALTSLLTRSGHAPLSIDSQGRVSLDRTASGYEVASIELSVSAKVPNVSKDEFERFANEAKETCPLSRALRAVPTTLNATLEPS